MNRIKPKYILKDYLELIQWVYAGLTYKLRL